MSIGGDSLDVLDAVNQCQIDQLRKAGAELNPASDCAQFGKHVNNVQAMIVHTYQLVAWKAVRQADAKEAASLWKEMADLCDAALAALKDFREIYPYCGTPEVYDQTLDYRTEAQKRYIQNLEDSECVNPPMGLFPKVT